MRAALFLATTISSLVAAAPPSAPTITSLKFSGTGCPHDSGSVKATSNTLGDTATFTYSQLNGDNTDNCEIHLQSSGASQGWQVAVKDVTYQGDLTLKSGSSLDTFTQVYWSENAGQTSVLRGSVTCTGPDISNSFTLNESTNDLKWSKCTGGDGNPGTLNVNFRPIIQGNSGTYNVKSARWNLVWRQC